MSTRDVIDDMREWSWLSALQQLQVSPVTTITHGRDAGPFSFGFALHKSHVMPMSSSPLLDDADAATLAAVLSFLDSADELSVGIAEPLHTPLGRREESGAVKYTTQHQRKKRAEITALRGQVEELEARLTHLQTVQRASLSSSSPRLSGSTEEQALWQEVALDERAKRLRAEQANRRLKEVAKHYRELGDAILGVLRKRRCPEVIAASVGWLVPLLLYSSPVRSVSRTAVKSSWALQNRRGSRL